MRNGDTKQNSCDIIANQRKGDYMKSNLEIQEKLYDFIKYIYPVLRQYPKSEKFSLQKDTKNCIMDILRYIIRAGKSTTKKKLLYDADVELVILRYYIRIAYDQEYISGHTYGVAAKKLTEIQSSIIADLAEVNRLLLEELENYRSMEDEDKQLLMMIEDIKEGREDLERMLEP